ncbi:MAG: hypothetical protein M3405_00735 [Acidobacteriota bacterium]|nr:hypothetical protein [Acidobacteriota bacterium]
MERQRKYLICFVTILLLNIGLSVVSSNKVFGQTPQISDQQPISAEVLGQPDSPLRLAIINVNNTQKTYQEIHYSIENTSDKEIFAYVILTSYKGVIGDTSARIPLSFPVGKLTEHSHFEQRANLKPDSAITFWVDYVEFTDGTSWGKDSQGRSKLILAVRIGQQKGFEQVKKLFAEQSIDEFIKILNKPIVDLKLPDKFREEREKVGFGFSVGYKSVFSRLKSSYEKHGVGAIFIQMDDLEKQIKNKKN